MSGTAEYGTFSCARKNIFFLMKIYFRAHEIPELSAKPFDACLMM